MEQDSDIKTSSGSGNLSIGTVAKLTGVSVHTLRAWEKRHSVVSVLRSNTGRRLYRPEDVHRLRLLRKLTQTGHSIGNIASLSDAQLEQMLDLEHHDDGDKADDTSRIEVCLFSDRSLENFYLPEPIKRHVDIALASSEVGELREALTSKKPLTVVAIFGTIQKHQLRLLRQLKETDGHHTYYVVFTFAQRDMIDELNAMEFNLVRAPISFDQLFRKILESQGEISLGQRLPELSFDEVPPHRFTRRQLEGLANIPSAIECECPQHLAELIRSLTLFEGYCQHCATTNRDDAELHNEIYKMAAQARHLMEISITKVLEAENINLDFVSGDH